MALYIKYRPKNFSELVKQEHIVNILKPKVLSSDTAHSNYLFYGPRGTWKTSTARIFAKALNCLNLDNGNPCNTCENCVNINANKTIDVVEIDAASHTWVDNVREEIISKAPYPPAALKKKVYIIDEVHMLSKPAFNALLKIMEEPPHYLVFILATTEIHKVPETIISRCQVFTFKKIPVEDLTKHLAMICEQEKISYTQEALISIAKIADWCARDAVKYLDQVSILWDISQEHVTSFLGVASDQLMQQFLAGLIEKNSKSAFAIIDSLSETWVDVNNFIKQCLGFIEEHFAENIAWYSFCSDIIKRILSGLKNFPTPSVLMKMEIYNAIDWKVQPTAPNHQTSFTTKTQPENTIPKTSNTTDDNPSHLSNNNEWQTTEKIENTVWNHTNNISDDNSLLLQIAEHATIPTTISSILKKSCILEHTSEKSTLYIFNKLQGSILQKPDNYQIIEKAFKEITNTNHWITLSIISKEEYIAMKL